MAQAPRQHTNFDNGWAHYLADPIAPNTDLGNRASVQHVPDLVAVSKDVDVLLLDGFGVLNTGFDPVAGMPAQIAEIQASGVHCIVLSNGATQPAGLMVQKYTDLGYNFSPENVITSRDALRVGLAEHHRTNPDFVWGLTPTAASAHPDLDGDLRQLRTRADFEAVDGFILLSTVCWSALHDWWLHSSLRDRARPVWVGNPDVCAPFPDMMSREPGHLSRLLTRDLGIDVKYFGKPHGNVYEVALARVAELVPSIDRSRIAMVGDSPHTDILGARQAGLKSVLMQDHGLLADQPLWDRLEQAGIWPDYLIAENP